MVKLNKTTVTFLFFSFILAQTYTIHAMERLKSFVSPIMALKNDPVAPKDFLKGLVALTCVDFLAMVCHELGHAVTGEAFFKNIAGIRVNTGPSITLKISKFFLKLGLIPFTGGSTVFDETNVVLTTKQDFIKFLIQIAAGPLAGATSSYLLFEGLKKTYLKNNPFAPLFQLLLTGNHLMNLSPIYSRENSDGKTFVQVLAALRRHLKS